jgi:hypothetical protein
MAIPEIITKHQLNQSFLAAKLGLSTQIFTDKMKTGFTTRELIRLRDYIIELGDDCVDCQSIDFDNGMAEIIVEHLKK